MLYYKNNRVYTTATNTRLLPVRAGPPDKIRLATVSDSFKSITFTTLLQSVTLVSVIYLILFHQTVTYTSIVLTKIETQNKTDISFLKVCETVTVI